MPGFADWLARTTVIAAEAVPAEKRLRFDEVLSGLRRRHQPDLSGLASDVAGGKVKREDQAAMLSLCACYLLYSSTPTAGCGDPVARFHLNNGARLERINFQADVSPKGVRQSFGLMVNYRYDLDELENNHQSFVGGSVTASRAVTSLA